MNRSERCDKSEAMHKLREAYGVFVLIKKEMKPRMKIKKRLFCIFDHLMILVKKILRMMIMLMCCIIL